MSLLDAPRALSRAVLQPGCWVLARARRIAPEPLARVMDADNIPMSPAVRRWTADRSAVEAAPGKARADRARAEAEAYLRQHRDRLEAELTGR